MSRVRTLSASGPIALVAVVLLLAACSSGVQEAVPAGPPGIRGNVVQYSADGGSGTANAAAQIMVEGPRQQPAGAVSDKASVRIPQGTPIFDAKAARVDVEKLAHVDPNTGLGPEVLVWFEGPVAESYPVQGTAKAVQIVSE